MRPHGQTKLGFFPLPVAEAKRLKHWLIFPERFSAVDPCVGNGVAFRTLLGDAGQPPEILEKSSKRVKPAIPEQPSLFD